MGVVCTPIMENQLEKNMGNDMETGVYGGIYWGYIGMTEKNMETTIMGL